MPRLALFRGFNPRLDLLYSPLILSIHGPPLLVGGGDEGVRCRPTEPSKDIHNGELSAVEGSTHTRRRHVIRR